MRLQLQEQHITALARQLSDVQQQLRANAQARAALLGPLKMFAAMKDETSPTSPTDSMCPRTAEAAACRVRQVRRRAESRGNILDRSAERRAIAMERVQQPDRGAGALGGQSRALKAVSEFTLTVTALCAECGGGMSMVDNRLAAWSTFRRQFVKRVCSDFVIRPPL